MSLFSNCLKVIHTSDSYALTWLDPDGGIRQERFSSRLMHLEFSKVLRDLLNGGFCFGSGVLFSDRKPRKELKEFILSHQERNGVTILDMD